MRIDVLSLQDISEDFKEFKASFGRGQPGCNACHGHLLLLYCAVVHIASVGSSFLRKFEEDPREPEGLRFFNV